MCKCLQEKGYSGDPQADAALIDISGAEAIYLSISRWFARLRGAISLKCCFLRKEKIGQ
jgi:hypothetical protein